MIPVIRAPCYTLIAAANGWVETYLVINSLSSCPRIWISC